MESKLSDGKEQVVGSRRQRLTARFLNGRPVGVVWCQFKSQSGNWKSITFQTPQSLNSAITNHRNLNPTM